MEEINILKNINKIKEYCIEKDCRKCLFNVNSRCELNSNYICNEIIKDKIRKVKDFVQRLEEISDYCSHTNCVNCILYDEENDDCMLQYKTPDIIDFNDIMRKSK